MSLGKTFTRSIVREVGRNYGKAISNSLLGDKHSTPVRMVGNSNDVTRKRGNKYHNKLDELIQKLAIKGATATLNQGQNIYNAYFELVEEAQADGVIDLDELVFSLVLNENTIQNNINSQITAYCLPDVAGFDINTKVSFFSTLERNGCFVDIFVNEQIVIGALF